MKLGMLAGGICRICGSDTLGANIGCGCMRMYERAVWIALRNHDEESLTYNYSLDMRYTMDKFVKSYEERLAKHNGDINKTFRSEFKRQFVPSVVEFYKKNGFVSKKQLTLVKRDLYYPYEGDETSEEDIKKLQKSFIADFKAKYDSEIVEIARNLWKQKKEKKAE